MVTKKNIIEITIKNKMNRLAQNTIILFMIMMALVIGGALGLLVVNLTYQLCK